MIEIFLKAKNKKVLIHLLQQFKCRCRKGRNRKHREWKTSKYLLVSRIIIKLQAYLLGLYFFILK